MRKRYIISNEVFNKIKSLLDTNKQQKPSISKLSRIYNMDRKSIRKYVNLIKNDKLLVIKNIDDKKYKEMNSYYKIVNNKLKNGTKKIHIYSFLKEKYNIKFSYSYFTLYLRNNKCKNTPVKNQSLFYKTLPGDRAQVDWKENFYLYNKRNEKIVFNVLLYKLSFSRYVKLYVTFDKNKIL